MSKVSTSYQSLISCTLCVIELGCVPTLQWPKVMCWCMHSHRRTQLQHTYHTHPLIVTDRAERAAFSHHGKSLARKKNWRERDVLKEPTGGRRDRVKITNGGTERPSKKTWLPWCHSQISVLRSPQAPRLVCFIFRIKICRFRLIQDHSPNIHLGPIYTLVTLCLSDRFHSCNILKK